MAGQEIGTYTVNIQAQITDFSDQLEKIKKQIEQVDPGSAIGRSLNKALSAADSKIKSLMRQPLRSIKTQGAVDTIERDFNTINEMLANMNDMLKQVSWEDLTGGLGEQLKIAQRSLDAASSRMADSVQLQFKRAIKDSAQFKDFFGDLGFKVKDLKNLDFDSLLSAADKRLEELQKNYDTAKAAREAIQPEYEAAKADMAALEKREAAVKEVRFVDDIQKNFFKGLSAKGIKMPALIDYPERDVQRGDKGTIINRDSAHTLGAMLRQWATNQAQFLDASGNLSKQMQRNTYENYREVHDDKYRERIAREEKRGVRQTYDERAKEYPERVQLWRDQIAPVQQQKSEQPTTPTEVKTDNVTANTPTVVVNADHIETGNVKGGGSNTPPTTPISGPPTGRLLGSNNASTKKYEVDPAAILYFQKEARQRAEAEIFGEKKYLGTRIIGTDFSSITPFGTRKHIHEKKGGYTTPSSEVPQSPIRKSTAARKEDQKSLSTGVSAPVAEMLPKTQLLAKPLSERNIRSIPIILPGSTTFDPNITNNNTPIIGAVRAAIGKQIESGAWGTEYKDPFDIKKTIPIEAQKIADKYTQKGAPFSGLLKASMDLFNSSLQEVFSSSEALAKYQSAENPLEVARKQLEASGATLEDKEKLQARLDEIMLQSAGQRPITMADITGERRSIYSKYAAQIPDLMAATREQSLLKVNKADLTPEKYEQDMSRLDATISGYQKQILSNKDFLAESGLDKLQGEGITPELQAERDKILAQIKAINEYEKACADLQSAQERAYNAQQQLAQVRATLGFSNARTGKGLTETTGTWAVIKEKDIANWRYTPPQIEEPKPPEGSEVKPENTQPSASEVSQSAEAMGNEIEQQEQQDEQAIVRTEEEMQKALDFYHSKKDGLEKSLKALQREKTKLQKEALIQAEKEANPGNFTPDENGNVPQTAIEKASDTARDLRKEALDLDRHNAKPSDIQAKRGEAERAERAYKDLLQTAPNTEGIQAIDKQIQDLSAWKKTTDDLESASQAAQKQIQDSASTALHNTANDIVRVTKELDAWRKTGQAKRYFPSKDKLQARLDELEKIINEGDNAGTRAGQDKANLARKEKDYLTSDSYKLGRHLWLNKGHELQKEKQEAIARNAQAQEQYKNPTSEEQQAFFNYIWEWYQSVINGETAQEPTPQPKAASTPQPKAPASLPKAAAPKQSRAPAQTPPAQEPKETVEQLTMRSLLQSLQTKEATAQRERQEAEYIATLSEKEKQEWDAQRKILEQAFAETKATDEDKELFMQWLQLERNYSIAHEQRLALSGTGGNNREKSEWAKSSDLIKKRAENSGISVDQAREGATLTKSLDEFMAPSKQKLEELEAELAKDEQLADLMKQIQEAQNNVIQAHKKLDEIPKGEQSEQDRKKAEDTLKDARTTRLNVVSAAKQKNAKLGTYYNLLHDITSGTLQNDYEHLPQALEYIHQNNEKDQETRKAEEDAANAQKVFIDNLKLIGKNSKITSLRTTHKKLSGLSAQTKISPTGGVMPAPAILTDQLLRLARGEEVTVTRRQTEGASSTPAGNGPTPEEVARAEELARQAQEEELKKRGEAAKVATEQAEANTPPSPPSQTPQPASPAPTPDNELPPVTPSTEEVNKQRQQARQAESDRNKKLEKQAQEKEQAAHDGTPSEEQVPEPPASTPEQQPPTDIPPATPGTEEVQQSLQDASNARGTRNKKIIKQADEARDQANEQGKNAGQTPPKNPPRKQPEPTTTLTGKEREAADKIADIIGGAASHTPPATNATPEPKTPDKQTSQPVDVIKQQRIRLQESYHGFNELASEFNTENEAAQQVLLKYAEQLANFGENVGNKNFDFESQLKQLLGHLNKELKDAGVTNGLVGLLNQAYGLKPDAKFKTTDEAYSFLLKELSSLQVSSEDMLGPQQRIFKSGAEIASYFEKIVPVDMMTPQMQKAFTQLQNATGQQVQQYAENLAALFEQAMTAANAELDEAGNLIDPEAQKKRERFAAAKAAWDKASKAESTASTKLNNGVAGSDQLKSLVESLQKQNQNQQAEIETLKKTVGELQGKLEGYRKSGEKPMRDFTGAYDKYIQGNRGNIDANVAAYQTKFNQLQSLDRFSQGVTGLLQRTVSIYAILRKCGQIINSIKSSVKELDDIMTQIAIVTDMTQEDLWQQMEAYADLAQRYGTSIKDSYAISQLFYQQGLQARDVMSMTEETLKMVKISGLSAADATNYMTTAVRSFKIEMDDAQRVVDVYSTLAASAATDTAELAVAMSKTASSAESVGMSFENTAAMMTVMIEAEVLPHLLVIININKFFKSWDIRILVIPIKI